MSEKSPLFELVQKKSSLVISMLLLFVVVDGSRRLPLLTVSIVPSSTIPAPPGVEDTIETYRSTWLGY
jgi:hypothetical protein